MNNNVFKNLAYAYIDREDGQGETRNEGEQPTRTHDSVIQSGALTGNPNVEGGQSASSSVEQPSGPATSCIQPSGEADPSNSVAQPADIPGGDDADGVYEDDDLDATPMSARGNPGAVPHPVTRFTYSGQPNSGQPIDPTSAPRQELTFPVANFGQPSFTRALRPSLPLNLSSGALVEQPSNVGMFSNLPILHDTNFSGFPHRGPGLPDRSRNDYSHRALPEHLWTENVRNGQDGYNVGSRRGSNHYTSGTPSLHYLDQPWNSGHSHPQHGYPVPPIITFNDYPQPSPSQGSSYYYGAPQRSNTPLAPMLGQRPQQHYGGTAAGEYGHPGNYQNFAPHASGQAYPGFGMPQTSSTAQFPQHLSGQGNGQLNSGHDHQGSANGQTAPQRRSQRPVVDLFGQPLPVRQPNMVDHAVMPQYRGTFPAQDVAGLNGWHWILMKYYFCGSKRQTNLPADTTRDWMTSKTAMDRTRPDFLCTRPSVQWLDNLIENTTGSTQTALINRRRNKKRSDANSQAKQRRKKKHALRAQRRLAGENDVSDTTEDEADNGANPPPQNDDELM